MDLKSSEPFWLIKNGIIDSYPSLRNDIETDILIVGGGITGSLIAHQCIEDGYKTVLIDRREIATGSTSATTSMLQYEIDVQLHELIEKIGEEGAVASYKACFDSIDTLGKISKKVKSDSGFKKKQSLYFADNKKHVSTLKKELEARKEAGFPVQWLEPEEIEKEFGLKKSYGGILSDQGASVDGFKLAHDILKYNFKKGLQIFDKTEIKSVQYSSSGITAKTDYGNTVKAKKIIYCNGFESTEIIKEKFVTLLSTYAIVGERFEDNQNKLKDVLIWNTADPYIYMRTTDDNRLLIGGEDEDFKNATKREKLLSAKATKLSKKVAHYLPHYDFRMDFAWAGTFGETDDGLPYIGEHKKFPSAYFVLGFGGNGITFSVIGMDIISQLLKGKQPELAHWFRFGR